MGSYNLPSKPILPVLIVLLAIGLIQASFTNIGLDEAYYWNFGQHLDLGYFDHPPMTALMVFIGSSLLPGTLGVRLLTVFMMVGLYYLIWTLIPLKFKENKKAPWIFFVLIFSNPLLTIYGFFTTPDVPLLFFTACFLIAFGNFLERSDLKNSLLLGLFMAALIYSKYHGILVILFAVLSRLRLLITPRFFMASLFGVILYIPHLLWQYQHDFVSFEYHLFYRSTSFEIKNVVEYFLNAFLVLNPFIWVLFIVGYIQQRKNKNVLPRVMHFLMWGFLAFFAFTSFRGHVEPHWLAIITIPMTIALFQIIQSSESVYKWFKIVGAISVLLLLTGRILVMMPLDLNTEFHKEDGDFYREIEKLSEGRNVVFTNSYTAASKYSFYTGKPAFSYNFITYRKSQFDLWDVDAYYWNKPAMFLAFYDLAGYTKLDMGANGSISYKFIDKLPLVNNVKVKILEHPSAVDQDQEYRLTLEVENPYDHDIVLKDGEHSFLWELYYFDLTKERVGMSYLIVDNADILNANSVQQYRATALANMVPNEYTIGIALHPLEVFPISSSKRTYPITIK